MRRWWIWKDSCRTSMSCWQSRHDTRRRNGRDLGLARPPHRRPARSPRTWSSPAVPTLETRLLMRLILLRLSAAILFRGRGHQIRSARTIRRAPRRSCSVHGAETCRQASSHRRHPRPVREGLGDSRAAQRGVAPRAVLPLGAAGEACPSVCPRNTGFAISRASNPVRAPAAGQVRHGRGRFVLSGQWWGTRAEDACFHRGYSFQEPGGCVQWLYVDRLTGATWVQGAVD